ncbi:prolyl oligopeptidase family serine peptidase [Polyangium sp. 15x6]|uniref:prolyl oligopeptidase family serine peptidase n=1 Tax=Polyangium sp. 15x6 TaxID=3042687 RepID=UPI00249A5B7C|nr:prolyl oligopeptidase family serine peptidase [Polyangium sp. 15x6]MDI3281958.1 prolyl oligopeptidase family serine peptidase [Polyangium sp. 15x6]
MRNLAPLLGALLLGACATKTAPPPTPPPAATTIANETQAKTEAPAMSKSEPKVEDPYLWLEEVLGDKPLAWVAERNAKSKAELEAAPGFGALRDRLRRIYDSKEKIPVPKVLGKYVYNFWRDDKNPRGLYRRATLDEFKKPTPKWEVVLDLDALAKAENENWVWHGADCLYPKYERCLLHLSRGGADASVVREFDTVEKKMVEGGFTLPEAKSEIYWKDLDTVYVGTDFGPDSLTDSGYPRIVKEWKRGTKLADAKTLFEGQKTDMVVSGERQFDHGKERDLVYRRPSFFTEELHIRNGDAYEKIDKPEDAEASVWDGQLLLKLRSAWPTAGKTWPAGSLLIAPLAEYRAGKREMTALFEPKPNTSLESYMGMKTTFVTVELEDVKSSVFVHTRTKNGFVRTKLETSPMSAVSAFAYDEHDSDDYWLLESNFTVPTTLALGNATKKARAETVKKNPAFFDAAGLDVVQRFATSKDGTKVPYFQIAKKNLPLDGTAPTLLEGYGGFEASMTPYYQASTGAGWLERGGVYVVANIRGGGEYGPAWHKAALKENRQRAYDDFIAIAEDLIARKVTSTPKLGIIGGSNGGLLMGVMMTQRPDLFGAIVCQVPLLDMMRYHKLLAGASWMDEYGDPDKPEERAALARFSPYQNLKSGTRYPRTLFTTSTRDDRVHPGHARKMVARLLELGQDLLYYENTEGGHGGAANNEQRAYMDALAFTFLGKQLGLLTK